MTCLYYLESQNNMRYIPHLCIRVRSFWEFVLKEIGYCSSISLLRVQPIEEPIDADYNTLGVVY